MAAQPPDKPNAPATVWSNDYIYVFWAAPEDNGAEITSYTVLIRGSDLVTYYTELTSCDGSQQNIVDNLQCVMHVNLLITAPFNLPWGSRVYTKIIATNIKGDSEASDAGTGAVIITYPDPPVNLVENVAQRSSSTLGFTWTEGENNHGAEVTSYRVSYSLNGGPFYVLASVTSEAFIAYSLMFGNTYTFKVESKNSYGYSTHSEPLEMLCAFRPDAPEAPSTEVQGN